MYRVVIYNSATGVTIHEPTEDPNDPHLYECKLVQGISGEIDSLSFKILPNNPGYDQLNCYTTMIEVIDTTAKPESAEFVGRVLTVAPNMEESGLVYKSVVCEDRLGYLCDSVQPYVEEQTYYGDSEKTGVQKFLELLLENHNSQVEDAKKIYPGTISFNTSSGNVTKGLNYQTTWDAIREKLLNSLGGEIQLYSFDGKLYLDYVASLGTTGEQVIEVAKNMRTATQDESPSEIITRLIPLGDYKDQESDSTQEYERINISSVNGGKLYIDDDDAIMQYGIIEGTVIWEDVTLPENLYEKGQEWLQNQTVEDSLTLSAYDLYLAGIDPDQIIPSNWYEVKNPLIGLDRYYRCIKRTTNVCDPVDKTYEMGAQNKSLALSISSNSQTAKDAADAAAAINANLSKTVNTLIAGNALILYLEATVADIEYAYIDRAEVEELLADYATIQYLLDYYASIEYLEANYASITSLEVAFEDVELINADVANIKNLLAGNMGMGDLQSIVLTTDNAYIEDAVIINALMDTVLASVLTAGVIYTDYIKIANNESQSLWIDGSTMQFTDENGTVRVQIGLDASGNYSYYLWDENGTLIWDAMGLTEAGLTGNGAIIKDAAVADDANISAYKLNIEELTSVLNENGQLVLSAEQVTIGGGTLDYVLTDITQQISDLEAMGIDSIVNYYAIGTADSYPPFEWGDEDTAVLGEGILGQMVLGVNGESNWSIVQPTAGEDEYVWFAQKVTYVDGTIEWTTPTLLTDYYLRNAVTIQQTELEIVQGQIQAKVWMSDIETIEDELTTTISDQYGILTVLINTVDARVGSLSTTVDEYYTSLYSQITALTLDVGSMTAEVREAYEMAANAIVEGTPYYAVSYSPDYYPPFEWDDEDTAVLGEGILGQMVLGVNGESNWTTEQPEAKEGQYIWIAYFRTRADGSTYWTDPTLLTDEWERDNATEMSERYSQLVLQLDSALLEVANVQAELATNYSTVTEVRAMIEESVTEESATIMQLVSYNYVDQETFTSTMANYYTGVDVDALIIAQADATSATILQTVSYTYATMNYVDDALSGIDLDGMTGIETYYAVADNNEEPKNLGWHAYEDFSGKGLPDGWSEINTRYGTFDYSGDDELGPCVKIAKTSDSSYRPAVGYYLPYAGNIRLSFKGCIEGESGHLVFYIGSSGTIIAEGNTKSREWVEYTYTGNVSESYLYIQVGTYSEGDISLFTDIKVSYPDEESDITWGTDYPTISAGEYLWVRYLITYADGHTEWTNPVCVSGDYVTQNEFTTNIASIEQYVNDSMAKINLTVNGGIGNTATITLTTNDGDIVQNLDLSAVRQAFADDKSAIEISAGTVAFISNTLIISSKCLELDASGNLTINTKQFTLDSSGNATFSGNLSAPSGTVGGWSISSDMLYDDTSTSSKTYITQISPDKLSYRQGYYYYEYSNGFMYYIKYTTENGSKVEYEILTTPEGLYMIDSDGTYWFQALTGTNRVSIVGTLTVNGSAITGSDEILKKNMTLVDDPEAFAGERDYEKVVDSLEPVSFQYKQETGEKKHIGFTYQNAVAALEAGGIDPDECAMVQETTDPNTGEVTGGIEYNDIVALLVYEVKKLKSEIQEMKGE